MKQHSVSPATVKALLHYTWPQPPTQSSAAVITVTLVSSSTHSCWQFILCCCQLPHYSQASNIYQ